MTDKIKIRLIGHGENIEREIDHVDSAVPQYHVLSATEQAVYHHSGTDEQGVAIYEYKGTEEKQYPKVHGSS